MNASTIARVAAFPSEAASPLLRAAAFLTGLTLIALALPRSAAAEPVRFSFAGHLEFIDPQHRLPDDIVDGAPFSGFAIYDSAAAVDEDAGSPMSGFYQFDLGYQVTIGKHTVSIPRHGIAVADNRPVETPLRIRDTFLVANGENATLADIQLTNIAVSLDDSTATVFDSDALPLPPDGVTIGDFDEDQRRFTFNGIGLNGPFAARGFVESIAFDVVPEPATALLLLAGLCIVGRRRVDSRSSPRGGRRIP